MSSLRIGLALIFMSETTIAQTKPADTQPQSELRSMLRIAWKKGTSLPQGVQDSAIGIIDDRLILVGGFCAGRDKDAVPGKPGKYPRGFLKKGWALNLKDPQASWVSLPDLPAIERQALAGIVVDEALYCWGGINYTAPFTYRDGYRLSKKRDEWVWETSLPELPAPAVWSGTCAIGSKIYLFGGADYDSEKFYTHTDRAGHRLRLGAKLLMLDTRDLSAGWRRRADCPGTPRFTPGMAVVDGKIYVFGGAGGDDNKLAPGGYSTVVDNWMYDPTVDVWTRLRDLPISSGNFFTVGEIAYRGRWIILVGGYQYPRIENPDGTVRPPYGKPTRHYPDKAYFSDVFVYDVQTGLFGTADPLPLNNNTPMTIVRSDRIYLAGGETGGAVIDGEAFGHHPDLYLVGTISLLDP
ncbi:MAG TPA: hypothetical protein PKY77_23160 [Phycisphaerae bacterium]|nr:hypothetical protein [Phycisphaerae bacterium]HRY71310.1 hypothetical protein [Phycisphaerae bacterium]HSA29698.1 hypothetical protein [Phycisphaerae bacterium]